MKVETDIIISITTNLIGRAVILVIMYIFFMSKSSKLTLLFYWWRQNVLDVTLTNNFQYQSQFLRMRVTNWSNIFVDQGQFSDLDFISVTHQRENVQFDDNLHYLLFRHFPFDLADWYCQNRRTNSANGNYRPVWLYSN